MIVLELFCFLVFISCNKQAQPSDLQSDSRLYLRNLTASSYTDPESHLKLARYYYDSGNKVMAFFISEKARGMFGDEDFNPVFKKVARIKLTESPEFKTKKDLDEYCRVHPDSFEAFLAGQQKLAKDKKIDAKEAEELMKEALSKFPNQYELKAMAAKYYLKGKKDYETAMNLYIDLYFHNPHFYDWEYAEFRIKDISFSRKKDWFGERIKSGMTPEMMAAEETNPRVLDVLLDKAKESWTPAMVPVMLVLMDNDDSFIQTGALHLLLNHASDFSDKPEIVRMLKGDDLVKRAMASFLVVKCLGSKEFPLLKDNLESGIELIQLDTIRALSGMGGEAGKKYLKANPPINATGKMKDLWTQEISMPEGKAGAGGMPSE